MPPQQLHPSTGAPIHIVREEIEVVVLVDEEGGGAAEAEAGVLVLVGGVGVGVASGEENWAVVYGV